MRYCDFVLRFDSAAGDEWQVVVTSPQGEDRGGFRLPFDDPGLLAVVGGRVSREVRSDEESTLEEIGGELFEAIFSGPIGRLYERCRACLQESTHHGLRLKLKLDLRDPGVGSLHDLPWESLYAEGSFLGLSSETSIVRYLDVPRPVAPQPRPSPLCVLVAISNPQELPQLDVVREQATIEGELNAIQGVKLELLKGVSLSSLRATLLDKTFHVLHFIGHGQFETSASRGELLFEDEGRSWPVKGEALAHVLSDFKALQVVVLNACDTARSGQLNPFAGVATALLKGGISSVVAMQLAISDRAAIRFSRAFYRRLAVGDPLDVAVIEGRHEIYGKDQNSAEWVAPVLFQRIPDGRVWKPLAPKIVNDEDTSKPARPRPRSWWSFGRWMRAASLALATLGAWFLLRLEEAPPGQVTVIHLTDESAEVAGLEEINGDLISLAALARLVDAVAKHKPSVIGLDVSLAQGEGAEVLAESLRQAGTGFVLASDMGERPLPVLSEACQVLADGWNRCEEASPEIITGPFTLGSQLASGELPFSIALASGLRPPQLAGQVILPLNAGSKANDAIVRLPADIVMRGLGGLAIQQQLVVIGGVFTKGREAQEIDLHPVLMPWLQGFSGAEIQALLAAYALGEKRDDGGERRRGLLWVVDDRYPRVLLLLVLLVGWRRPSIYGWFVGLYVFGALVMQAIWLLVLPLWPAWSAIVLTFLRGKQE